jgi:hypothetical protein
MSTSFPHTLVGYEIAVMEALRRELGADLARIPAPEGREIREAFFRRTPPLDFAWQWLQDYQMCRRDEPQAPKNVSGEENLTLF